jgi:hypothetical protein
MYSSLSGTKANVFAGKNHCHSIFLAAFLYFRSIKSKRKQPEYPHSRSSWCNSITFSRCSFNFETMVSGSGKVLSFFPFQSWQRGGQLTDNMLLLILCCGLEKTSAWKCRFFTDTYLAKKQPPVYHHYYVLDALAALALQSGRMPEKASCACARTRPGGSPAAI